MDLIRLVEEKILSVVNEMSKIFEGEIDYLTFEVRLKKELDSLGRDLLQLVLETLEEKIHESEERKRDWKVVRRRDQKAILTIFGQLIYERSYYQHKESKQYAYLVDEQIGITPHARVGPNLKAALLEASSKMSYEEATVQESSYNPELKVSRQTVALTVNKFAPVKSLPPQEKRHVRTLYIEADEDHVRIRDHKRKKPSLLIYVHEGVTEEGSRRRLKSAKYFTRPWGKSEELWWEVLDYLEARYDLSKVEKIYLLGDGASWIRAGLQYLPSQTVFILDKYHLEKYIQTATAHAPELKRLIHRGIKSVNKQAVLTHLHEALWRTDEKPRRKRIVETIGYIERNWDGIENGVKHPGIGCSAEGHVSHILAARLSSRPMAWSLQGAENMAAMRVAVANGESIRKQYLAMQASILFPAEIKEAVQERLKRLPKKILVGVENFDNIPLFRGGHNLTRVALKSLNEFNAVI